MKTPDMFAELKPPRQKPRKLMHVFDTMADCCCDEGDTVVVRFECKLCNFKTKWMTVSLTEAKRGIPCPRCNS